MLCGVSWEINYELREKTLQLMKKRRIYLNSKKLANAAETVNIKKSILDT